MSVNKNTWALSNGKITRTFTHVKELSVFVTICGLLLLTAEKNVFAAVDVRIQDTNNSFNNSSGSENDFHNAQEISNALPIYPDPVPDTERDLNFRALLCDELPRNLLPYYRFHLTTRKCYLTGTQGPCGPNMIFVKESFTRAIGKCICDPVVGQHRPLVRHPETNQCYFLYTQGFCEIGEWLVPISGENINRASNSYWAICRQNQCRPRPLLLQIETVENSTTKNGENSSSISSLSLNPISNPHSNSSEIDIESQTYLTYTVVVSEPIEDQIAEFVIYNQNCVQLGIPTEFCPENGTLGFQDGILSCIIIVPAPEPELESLESQTVHPVLVPEVVTGKVKMSEPESDSKFQPEFPNSVNREQMKTITVNETTTEKLQTVEIFPIPNSIFQNSGIVTITTQAPQSTHLGENENNEILATSEFRRRKRSIFFSLFPSWSIGSKKCPEDSSFNFITRECHKFRRLPFGFRWNRFQNQ